MKVKKIIIILVVLIIATVLGICLTVKTSNEYDQKVSDLNCQILELQEKEKTCTDLINKKSELISNTKKEIVNSKKGSSLEDLQEQKKQLIQEINNI